MPDDLIRTDPDSFMRIEYEDETWIEVGPETQLELGHPAERRAKGPALYLLSGWLKVGCAASDNGAKNSLASTWVDCGNSVDRNDPSEAAVQQGHYAATLRRSINSLSARY